MLGLAIPFFRDNNQDDDHRIAQKCANCDFQARLKSMV